MPISRVQVLTAACVGLGALLWLDRSSVPWSLPFFGGERHPDTVVAMRSRHDPAPPMAPPAAGEARFENPLASLDKAQLNNWTERPLFASSRRRPPPPPKAIPPPPPPAPVEAPRPKPPTYVLLGTIYDGTRSIALLRKEGDNTSFRVEAGDMIGGWHVAKVEAKSILLQRTDGTSQSVRLNGQ